MYICVLPVMCIYLAFTSFIFLDSFSPVLSFIVLSFFQHFLKAFYNFVKVFLRDKVNGKVKGKSE